LATVTARHLYGSLLDEVPLPSRITENLHRWQPSAGTVKVDWALDAPIPWTDDRLHETGTVHLADGLDALSRYACDLSTKTPPHEPFVVLGQMTTTDPTRSPAGTESAWAYTHVPQKAVDESGEPTEWDESAMQHVVAGIEKAVEAKAPGFGSLVRGRFVQGPIELERANPNLIGGDLSAGTTQLHQQLVFRPLPGAARAGTPVKGLYLAGATAHPGGGVHGAPGANAARAAIWHDRLMRWTHQR
jgi:phytoene dehydrogenase-like protein